MSKKVLNVATFGLAGSILKPFGSSRAPVDPAAALKLDDNQTLIGATDANSPRRRALAPQPQIPVGNTTILSDRLGG
jgi:hypothetical protein